MAKMFFYPHRSPAYSIGRRRRRRRHLGTLIVRKKREDSPTLSAYPAAASPNNGAIPC